MKILFMGTPDFAAVVLKTLIDNGMEIIGAVSQPDKPKGRGHKTEPTDVKKTAEAAGIPVFQPDTLKNETFKETLSALNPDIIVVAAYGKLLPEYIINYPKYGCINVHASLLPKYRGAAPIQWAVINGEKVTGVTIMQMDKGLDTGDILETEQTEIGEYETAQELFDRLAEIGGNLLVKTLYDIENCSVSQKPQDETKSTYAPMIKKETGLIDWEKPARMISKLICGMNSWPLASTLYKGGIMKIAEACVIDEKTDAKPGTILALVKKQGLTVACGDGILCIRTAQFPNSRKMNVEDYARGHEIEIGVVLG